MRKLFIFLLMAMAMLFIVQSSFAGDDIYNDGKWKEDSDGVWQPIKSNVGGYRVSAEFASTYDTLVAADSGKRFVSVAATDVTYSLPAASSVGLVYTFIAGSAKGLKVDPSTTDTIKYASLSAGDRIMSTGTMGDSITLICGMTGYWYVNDMKGSWADAN